MVSRRVAWGIVALASLATWQMAACPNRNAVPDGVPDSRPSNEEVVRMFGGGPTDDAERDVALRKQLVGRWIRSDDRMRHDFGADGSLHWWSRIDDPTAVGTDRETIEVQEFDGRWEINNGWIRLHTPESILVLRLRFTDDGKLQLYDMIERIAYAMVFHRRP